MKYNKINSKHIVRKNIPTLYTTIYERDNLTRYEASGILTTIKVYTHVQSVSHKDAKLVEARFKLERMHDSPSCLVTRASTKGPVIRLEAREHARYV